MADAADKDGQSNPQPQNRGRRQDQESNLGAAQKEWGQQLKKRKKWNTISETYYELVKGEKLVLCKKTKIGSVHRVLVGTTTDKEFGESVKAQVNKLQKEGKLRVRV